MWYDAVGNDTSFTTIRVDNSSKPWLTIAQARDLGYGEEGQPNFYTVKATVNLVQTDNCLYRACPSETNCWKKVKFKTHFIFLFIFEFVYLILKQQELYFTILFCILKIVAGV